MKNSTNILRLLSNVQILSALIWAATILACSYFSDKGNIAIILVTAAGFHVLLMSHFSKAKELRY